MVSLTSTCPKLGVAFMPIIPQLVGVEQEDWEFEASLSQKTSLVAQWVYWLTL
jgi:hypothetical protein